MGETGWIWTGDDDRGMGMGYGIWDEKVQMMEWTSVSLLTLFHLTFAADLGFSVLGRNCWCGKV